MICAADVALALAALLALHYASLLRVARAKARAQSRASWKTNCASGRSGNTWR